MTGADFGDGVVEGGIDVSNGVATLNKEFIEGVSGENNQFQFQIRQGSVTGDIWATTATITVTDQELSFTTTLLRSDTGQWNAWYSSGNYTIPQTSGSGYFVVLYTQSQNNYRGDSVSYTHLRANET